MPLIDSVIELTVKQRDDNIFIVAEKDGTEYEFHSENNQYIENETLSVRVTGLDRSLEIGKKDRLLGVVVAEELKLTDTINLPATLEDNGIWDPVWLYGPTAAKDFFPEHHSKKWRLLAYDFTSSVPDEDQETLHKASVLFSEKRFDEAQKTISPVLGKIPWLLDLYHVMGMLSLAGQRLATARKYFQFGILLSESILPDTDDFILNYRNMRNSIYMSCLHSLANLFENSNQKKEAIALYKKIYRLMPQDPAGVRYNLQQLTGNPYPLTDDDFRGYPIDPYVHFNHYTDFPLRDGYDPNSKIDYEKWLSWEESYRHLLIFNSHFTWFKENQFTEKDMLQHIIMHDLAESSLARNEYPDIRVGMAARLAKGLKRHDIIHEIGQMIFSQMSQNAPE